MHAPEGLRVGSPVRLTPEPSEPHAPWMPHRPDLDPDRIGALTFDCYGTLIDCEAGTIEVLRPLLAHNGIALSDDDIIKTFQDLEEP
jgi:hypothetical protein